MDSVEKTGLAKLAGVVSPRYLETALFVLLIIAASYPVLIEYLNITPTFAVLTIVLFPLILYIRKPGEFSRRYFYVALACIPAYVIIQSPIFIFFGICAFLFFILESRVGKLNRLAPVLVVLFTPLTKYVFDVFGFPVRLQLSKTATDILNLIGYTSEARGNIILLNGAEFTVDPSCMGLKMVVTSLLLALMFVSQLEKRNKRQLPLMGLIAIVLAALFFIVVANLVRILLLVVLQYPPETMGHEVVGLAALILIGLVPVYYLVRFMVNKTGSAWKTVDEQKPQVPKKGTWVYASVLLVTFAFISWSREKVSDMPVDAVAQSYNIPGYEKHVLKSNVVRFFKHDATVHIKPCKGVFRSDHQPLICWSGSGYTFSHEQVIEFNGTPIYTARLVSETNVLQTAWWYDNGEERTIDQWEWRWKMIKGAPPYRLVNVTSTNHGELMREVNLVWNRVRM